MLPMTVMTQGREDRQQRRLIGVGLQIVASSQFRRQYPASDLSNGLHLPQHHFEGCFHYRGFIIVINISVTKAE